ncbi:hypothetical protein [Nitratiruptor tergarcus]|uniref:Flagellar assembly protein FliH n=1 Tax=Nitratiruptor tergarcus DSM 16512 TaxID=1069081 RepID=A0A1W1WSK3_9BACT|nr:hypothetical protein [Nitratiruptor tergarcus]SMC09291.1 hypothetical protein SAMN05660197_1097 [Nitratiruptor tergarcus DSM 16512]
MKLELDDFTAFEQMQEASKELKEKVDTENFDEKIKEIERFYQQKIEEMEKEYKELIAKVSKESYEQGFSDAEQKFNKVLEVKIQELKSHFLQEKEQEIAHLQTKYLDFEKEFAQKYNLFLHRFTDIVLDNVNEILEFLFIDKKNMQTITEAIEKLLEDFSNYMPLDIIVSPNMFEDIKKRFETVQVKRSEELKENEFIIEFHDFKIENKIEEKLNVIKDEIKRETKKLT